MTLASLIIDYLKYLQQEKNASEKTIRNYRHYLSRFLEFAGPETPPKELDLQLIRKYRLYLSKYVDPQTEKLLKGKTQNFFMIALRSFLRYLAQTGTPSLPAEQVELVGQDDSPLKVLDQAFLNRLLSSPDTSSKEGLRDKAILEVLFSTGLRVSELTSLNTDTINLEQREFVVIGKGKKERTVSLTDSAAEWLEKYLASRKKDNFKPLFIRYQGRVEIENNGERMRLTTRSIERIVEKYVKAIGLPIKATPQTLRHSLAKDLLVNGADLKSVQEVLGHSNISTTQIYAHITKDQFHETDTAVDTSEE